MFTCNIDMWLLVYLAAYGWAPIGPPVTCRVAGDEIIVTFGEHLSLDMDKFAIVKGTLRHGEWQDVVNWGDNTTPPLRLSPYRPGIKRLVVDIRRQLATRLVERTGRTQLVRAFSGAGQYMLVFSDNIETEPENMTSVECKVRIR